MSIMDYWKAFNGVGKIKKEIKDMEEKKAGWRTSEFWVSVAGIVGIGFSAFGGFIPAALAAKIILGMTTAYTVARAVVKVTPSPKDDAFVEAVALKLAGIIKQEPPKP